MENSEAGVQELPTNFSSSHFRSNIAQKVISKVSKQLARPNVAGFQARLDTEDFSALLKSVSNEKIDVLLDEYMVEYGGRRASLIEEMHGEDQIPLRELYYGEPGLMFGIIGEASTGKTSLLLHLQWRINCHHNKILRELKCEDTTWAYFQIPDSEEGTPLITCAPPLPSSYSQNVQQNPQNNGSHSGLNSAVVTGEDVASLRGLGSSSQYDQESPKCPCRFLGIYVFGSELVRREVGPNGAFDIATILEAAYSTYVLRLPIGQVAIAHDEFIQAYKSCIMEAQANGSVGIILLVDGFDFVDRHQRAPLLSSIALTLQNNPSTFFRVFFASRPNGLFRLEEMPDSIIFLCLDRLFSLDFKEKLLAKIAPTIASKLVALGRDSVEARIHRRLIRSCHSPLLVFLLAQLKQQPNLEISACLFDLFEHFFNMTVKQSKMIRGEPTDVPKVHKIGSYEMQEQEFYQLVDLVIFFYHCWIPETYRKDWNTRERFEHLLFYLLKHQSSFLQQTTLGKLREHYITQRNQNNKASTTAATAGTTKSDEQVDSSSNQNSSSNQKNEAPLNDPAYVDLAIDLWTYVAEWLISVGLAHRLTRRSRSRSRVNSVSLSSVQSSSSSSLNITSPSLSAVNSSGGGSVGGSGGSSSSNTSPNTTTPPQHSLSPQMTHLSSGFSFEILLKDEQQIQFHCARFLMNTDFSTPILDAINQARASMRGFDNEYPMIFSWQDNYFLTNKHWNYIYDMMASKKGAVWISKIILPENLTINEWLAQMRRNKGVDKDDLGQIRFYRLLRGFALQQEDRDLNAARQLAKELQQQQQQQQSESPSSLQQQSKESPSSLQQSKESGYTSIGHKSDDDSSQGLESPKSTRSSSNSLKGSNPDLSDLQISAPIPHPAAPHQNPFLRSFSTSSLGRLALQSAEEVQIADLKEAFGMTFVSILEDNPSAIVHIEKAPVSSLACFSQNAISIILDKMVLLLKQGNIFVVADLLINLDKHGLINQDIVNKVIEVVTTSKDYKPIRPALRFLSSRTPSHRHLGVIINCLSAKDQDAQNEAVEALNKVAQAAVQQSKKSFLDAFQSYYSLQEQKENENIEIPCIDHVKEEAKATKENAAFVPFGTTEEIREVQHITTELPHDMVITGEDKRQSIEELYLIEESGHEKTASIEENQTQSNPITSQSYQETKQSHINSTIDFKDIPFLHNDFEWSLLLRSAISLLVDFVGLDIHKSSKNATFYNNTYEPRVRMMQCKHLASLIEMMESEEAGTRLLPFILLGSTTRGNDYDRDTEKQQLEAQLCILEEIGKVYTSHRRSSFESDDLIEEMAKNSAFLRGIGYIFHDLLGQQAAKYAVMSEDLIKSKPDLLSALNSWAFARLSSEARKTIFCSPSIREKPIVQQSILELIINNKSLVEIMDPTDLTVVVAGNFGKKESNFSLRRTALKFLEVTALSTTSQDYRLHAIDKIVFLLGIYGFNDPVVTEPLLRILDSIMSTEILNENSTNSINNGNSSNSNNSNNSNNPNNPNNPNRSIVSDHFQRIDFQKRQQKLSSSFQTPSQFPRPHFKPRLTRQEHDELYRLLNRNNMRQKLIQAFESQSSKRFWVGKVLTCSLLRHFVQSDSEDALEYVSFLSSNVPEIRSLALTELRKIDVSLVPALLQRLKGLIAYEEPLVRTTYSLVIGTLGMRPELQSMAVDVACFHMNQLDYPDVQQHGVNIISIIGNSVKDNAAVASRFESILQTKIAVLEQSIENPESPGLSKEDIGLLLSIVDCITTIGLTGTPVLLSSLKLLKDVPDPALKTAICLAFKQLSPSLASDQKLDCEPYVLALFSHREGYVREIGIKITRFLGRDCIKHSASKLIRFISDPEIYVRKQAIKAVTCLLHKGDEQAKKEALLLLPAVSSALEDKSPLVVVQALKFLNLLKSRNRSVSSTLARLATRMAAQVVQGVDPEDEATISIDADGIPVITSMPAARINVSTNQMMQSSSQSSINASNQSSVSSPTVDADEDDPWYIRKVIQPNADRITSLLHRRRYRYNLAVKIGVLSCLGHTKLLHNHLSTFSEMLNSDNISTLVEFSDTLRKLGPQILQYIPSIVNVIKPGSPLVRNLVRLLSRYEKQMDARTCNKLFSLPTILSMMKNRDANVRRVAVSLMGKKVLEKPKHIWVIIQMWGDKNNKVRKEVMEVLGDIGKTNPEYISHIMNLIDTDSVSSVLVWRYLSKSWGILIGNLPPNANETN